MRKRLPWEQRGLMRKLPKFIRPHRNTIRHWLFILGLLFMRYSQPWFVAGTALVVAGALFRLWAKGHLTQRVGLAITGPYQICRNPFYLGNLLVDAGVCAMIGRVEIALPYLVLWFVFHYQKIHAEEADLGAMYGDEYRAFLDSVPRLMPRLWLLVCPGEEIGRFSWLNRNIAQRIEIPRFLSAVSLPPLFYAWNTLRVEGMGFFWQHESTAFYMFCLFIWLQLLSRALRNPLRGGRRAVTGWIYSRGARTALLFASGAALLAAASSGHPWLAFVPLGITLIVEGCLAAARLHERHNQAFQAAGGAGAA